MAGLKLEAWTALAPTLEHKEDWLEWFATDHKIAEQPLNVSLKHVPMMLRRRFNALGKCAMGAISQLAIDKADIPCVFASQHGDTKLTLSLLESIGRHEDMSPTGFSLAVHNAVSGLYSIITNTTREITAIAATEGLIINALIESIGQLQSSNQVLCIIYDVPLPSVYQTYSPSSEFPYAIALLLSSETGETITLNYLNQSSHNQNGEVTPKDELRNFLGFLLNESENYTCQANGSIWSLQKTLTNDG